MAVVVSLRLLTVFIGGASLTWAFRRSDIGKLGVEEGEDAGAVLEVDDGGATTATATWYLLKQPVGGGKVDGIVYDNYDHALAGYDAWMGSRTAVSHRVIITNRQFTIRKSNAPTKSPVYPSPFKPMLPKPTLPVRQPTFPRPTIPSVGKTWPVRKLASSLGELSAPTRLSFHDLQMVNVKTAFPARSLNSTRRTAKPRPWPRPTTSLGTRSLGALEAAFRSWVEERKIVEDLTGSGRRIQINFQDEQTGSVPGWEPDFGEQFKVHGAGLKYGWKCGSPTTQGRNRGGNYGVLDRTLVIPDREGTCPDEEWKIEVANGAYNVELVLRDVSYSTKVSGCQLQGQAVGDGAVQSGIEAKFLSTVRVTQGFLTFKGSWAHNCEIVNRISLKRLEEVSVQTEFESVRCPEDPGAEGLVAAVENGDQPTGYCSVIDADLEEHSANYHMCSSAVVTEICKKRTWTFEGKGTWTWRNQGVLPDFTYGIVKLDGVELTAGETMEMQTWSATVAPGSHVLELYSYNKGADFDLAGWSVEHSAMSYESFPCPSSVSLSSLVAKVDGELKGQTCTGCCANDAADLSARADNAAHCQRSGPSSGVCKKLTWSFAGNGLWTWKRNEDADVTGQGIGDAVVMLDGALVKSASYTDLQEWSLLVGAGKHRLELYTRVTGSDPPAPGWSVEVLEMSYRSVRCNSDPGLAGLEAAMQHGSQPAGYCSRTGLDLSKYTSNVGICGGSVKEKLCKQYTWKYYGSGERQFNRLGGGEAAFKQGIVLLNGQQVKHGSREDLQAWSVAGSEGSYTVDLIVYEDDDDSEGGQSGWAVSRRQYSTAAFEEEFESLAEGLYELQQFDRRSSFSMQQYFRKRHDFANWLVNKAQEMDKEVARNATVQVVGGSAAVTSGVLAIGGILAAPFTGGLSLGLTVAAIGVGVAGGVANTTSSVVKDAAAENALTESNEWRDSMAAMDEAVMPALLRVELALANMMDMMVTKGIGEWALDIGLYTVKYGLKLKNAYGFYQAVRGAHWLVKLASRSAGLAKWASTRTASKFAFVGLGETAAKAGNFFMRRGWTVGSVSTKTCAIIGKAAGGAMAVLSIWMGANQIMDNWGKDLWQEGLKFRIEAQGLRHATYELQSLITSLIPYYDSLDFPYYIDHFDVNTTSSESRARMTDASMLVGDGNTLKDGSGGSCPRFYYSPQDGALQCSREGRWLNLIGKSASQSSTGYSGPASRAIDGSPNGDYSKNSCSHTLKESNPWWQVDLGADYQITTVRIANRDILETRLDGLHISVDGQDCARNVLMGAGVRDVPCQAYGRVLKIRLPKTEFLTLCEVQVAVSEANWLDMRSFTARQSSTYSTATAGRAVDGNTANNYGQGSCAHTLKTASPWWEVDLGRTLDISAVKITNRKDFKPERLSGFSVYVDGVTCKSNVAVSASSPLTFTVPCKATGQVVRIQLAKTEYLTLCEVTVDATEPQWLDMRSFTARQSSTSSGPAQRAIDGNSDGVFNNGHCTHTQKDVEPWWEVDLGTERDITAVRIANRVEYTSVRLSGFSIFVDGAPCAINQEVTSTTPSVFEVPCKATGRILKIMLVDKTEYLHMCEVTVAVAPPTSGSPKAITASGTNVLMQSKSDDKDQAWFWSDDGYLSSAQTDLVITQVSAGGAVKVQAKSDGAIQRWTLRQ